jgi:hypothetical protein
MTKEEAAEILLSGKKSIPCDCGCNVPPRSSNVTMLNEQWIEANVLLNTMSLREAVDALTENLGSVSNANLRIAKEVLTNFYQSVKPPKGVDSTNYMLTASSQRDEDCFVAMWLVRQRNPEFCDLIAKAVAEEGQ